jgi:GntR family transcriptional regulator, histidine utilization repressor
MKTASPNHAPWYQQLKRHLMDQISAGRLKPGDRLPSEHELARRFSVSRMTATRAFNELEAEGQIVRVQGVGSFVSAPKVETAAFEIHDIAAEIRESGQAYACTTLRIGSSRNARINALMGLSAASVYFRTCLLHHAGGMPVQIEDRFVNPAFAPNYLDEDFARTTPYQALMALASLQAAEHILEAAMPTGEQAGWLKIGVDEPCVVLRRRTWSMGIVASIAVMTSPSSRYRYAGRLGTRPPAAERLPPL